jgi:hypothetical protein
MPLKSKSKDKGKDPKTKSDSQKSQTLQNYMNQQFSLQNQSNHCMKQ